MIQEIHVLWIGIEEPTEQDMERIRDFMRRHPDPKSVKGIAVTPNVVCETEAGD